MRVMFRMVLYLCDYSFLLGVVSEGGVEVLFEFIGDILDLVEDVL
jgi:hypothetical protein